MGCTREKGRISARGRLFYNGSINYNRVKGSRPAAGRLLYTDVCVIPSGVLDIDAWQARQAFLWTFFIVLVVYHSRSYHGFKPGDTVEIIGGSLGLELQTGVHARDQQRGGGGFGALGLVDRGSEWSAMVGGKQSQV